MQRLYILIWLSQSLKFLEIDFFYINYGKDGIDMKLSFS